MDDEAPSRLPDLAELLDPSVEALDTDDEELDPSFDLDSSMKSDTDHLMDTFCEEWVAQLDWEDKVSLGLFICFQLKHTLRKGETEAAELAGLMIMKSEKTIRDWRAKFFANGGVVEETKQGRYQRSGVLWRNEDLNKKAARYIRENAFVKGRANLTAGSFCSWINQELLPNETVEPGFPRKVSVDTARTWMHELGFEVLLSKKGTFVDGHERDDVVQYRNVFLRQLISHGFLNPSNAPSEEAKKALPEDLVSPSQAVLDKTIVFFHDESTFQSNDDQATFWGTKGTHVMRPKSKGAGIMVSDYIDERNGYLALTNDEYSRAKVTDPNIRRQAREFLEYGESKEGYWTSDKFMNQMEMAVAIAEHKYPMADGWKHIWIFDHSSCHGAMAEDSLDVNRMNVKPGGKQRRMRGRETTNNELF